MNAKVSTIIRTVLQVLALIALAITQLGIDQVNDVAKYFVITVVVVISLINWWYNNSFTDAAVAGDILKDYLKENPNVKLTDVIISTEKGETSNDEDSEGMG